MGNTIDWGQAAVNNTIGFGDGAENNTIGWGDIQADSWSPETNLTGTGGTPAWTNTLSTTFDGVDDTINIGVTPLDLRFNRLDTFSFSAWVKVDTTQNNVIISNQRAPSTNYRGYYFAVNLSNQIIVILRSNLSDRLIKGGPMHWHICVITIQCS